MSSDSKFEYSDREVDPSKQRYFRPGEGRITGYLAASLGIMSFLGVLCFLFPSYLTTADFRSSYDVHFLRKLLAGTMWTSLILSMFTFIRWKNKRKGAIGLVFTLVAFALGGWEVQVGEIKEVPITLGIDWMVLSMFSASVFVFIEKIVPKYKEQAILRPGWRMDMVYFAMNHLLIGVLLLVGNKFAPAAFGWAIHDDFQGWIQALPFVVQVFILLFCADFVFYCMHRMFHTFPALWRFHAVHHSSTHMDWLAGSRTHFLETLVDRTMIMVPLYLLGTTEAALNGYAVWVGFQAVFIHANVSIATGPLKYVLVTPLFHHWHHSSEKPAIDTNYGATFPFFDYVFGTYHMPTEHWPADYGTVTPIPRTFVSQFFYPFTSRD